MSIIDEEEQAMARDSDDDDAALMELEHAAVVDGAAAQYLPEPPREYPFHQKLGRDLDKKLSDIRGAYPFPQLTNNIDMHMASAESMTLLEFLYPMGHRLTKQEFEHGGFERDLTEWAHQTHSLAQYERIINREHALKNPNTPPLSILAHLHQRIRDSYFADDNLEAALKEVMVEFVPAPNPDAVIQEQTNVVQQALIAEGERVKLGAHDIIFKPVTEPDSTNEIMGIMDFLPIAFLYDTNRVRNRIRSHVEAALRQAWGLNDPAAHTMDPQEHAKRETAVQNLTEQFIRQMAENDVDNIPSYYLENDILLEFRIANQARMALLYYQVQTGAQEMLEAPESRTSLLKNLENGYIKACQDERRRGAEAVVETIHGGDRIADALKSAEFRTWFERYCNAQTMVSLGADQPILTSHAKPFVQFIQHLSESIYTVSGVREPGTRLFYQIFSCALDSQSWAFNQREPHGNVAVFGDTAVGKSMLTQTVISRLPPGIAQSMSTFSTQAFATSTNQDNKFFVMEEAKASLVTMDKEAKDSGVSNDVNIMKDLMTRSCSLAYRNFRNPENGRVTTAMSWSSCHSSHCWLSNSHVDQINPALGRRMAIIVQPKMQGDSGFRAEDIAKIDYLNDDSEDRNELLRERITFAMYIMIRSLIKAAVVQAPDRSEANMVIVEALARMGVTASTTNLHRFVQFAENIWLYYAAHMICWSPYQADYHHPDNAKENFPRWSGSAIVDLLEPFLVIGKEPALFSVTALGFLVQPTQVDSFIRNLVPLLHIDKPVSSWTFRKFPPTERNGNPDYDVNYVILEGVDAISILRQVAMANNVFVLRPEDLRSFAYALNKRVVTGHKFEIQETGDRGIPLEISAPRGYSEVRSFEPFIFEKNEGRSASAPTYRMAVSLHFLQTYFGQSVLDTAKWTNLQPKNHLIEEFTFDQDAADGIAYATRDSDKIIDAFHDVLGTMNLEVTEFGTDLPDACYDYATAITHRPITLRVHVEPQPGATLVVHEKTMMLSGVTLLAHIPRNPQRTPFLRINSHQIPKAYEEVLKEREKVRGNTPFRRHQAEMRKSLGYTHGKYDGDYTMGSLILQDRAFPGVASFLRRLGMPEEALEPFSNPETNKPWPSPLPLAMGPISYLLQERICRDRGYHIGNCKSPADAIYQQIDSAMKMVEITHLAPGSMTDEQKLLITDFSDVLSTRSFTGRIDFGSHNDPHQNEQRRVHQDALQAFFDQETAAARSEAADAMDIS
jgi:hypothetical protein